MMSARTPLAASTPATPAARSRLFMVFSLARVPTRAIFGQLRTDLSVTPADPEDQDTCNNRAVIGRSPAGRRWEKPRIAYSEVVSASRLVWRVTAFEQAPCSAATAEQGKAED